MAATIVAVPAGAEVSFDEPPPPAKRRPRPAPIARSNITATRWGCRTPRLCRRRIRWGWITSPSMRATTATTARSNCRREKSSAPASNRSLPPRASSARSIRAPGTIQLDERRISVIAMRAESYVQKVADVTTGTHVVKGQPLMEVYSPQYRRRRPNIIATSTPRPPAGTGLWQRFAAAADESRCSGCRHRRDGEKPDRSDRVEWTSPRDGIVLERNAIEGMRAQPGDVLFRIADHSLVWA